MAKKTKAKKAMKTLRTGKYACVVCGRTEKGPVYCCGPSIIQLHLPKKMVKK